MGAPKVSLCIPVYNAASFLAETLQSALRQDFSDFEIVAIDNRSDDGSWEILEDFRRRDARFRCFRNESNLGMVGNFNACLQRSQGEYVHFLLADDPFPSPRSLSAPAEMLDRDSSISLVASPRLLIDEHSSPLGSVSSFPGGLNAAGPEIINLCLFTQKNLIGEPSAVMFRRSQAVRGFNPAYRQLVDLDMWFHLLEQGRFAFIGEPLASFRMHQKQLTRAYTRELAHLDDFLLFYQEYFCRPYIKLPAWFRAFYLYEKYYRFWKNGRESVEQETFVRERISREYGLSRFRALFPFYKLFNPVWKINTQLRLRSLSRRRS